MRTLLAATLALAALLTVAAILFFGRGEPLTPPQPDQAGPNLPLSERDVVEVKPDLPPREALEKDGPPHAESETGNSPKPTPLVYTSESIVSLQAAGMSDIDIRLRIFAAKMDRYSRRIVDAREKGDVPTVKALYDTSASNIAEAYLVSTGRPGMSAEEVNSLVNTFPKGLAGSVIQLNNYAYVLPEGELPFVDQIKGVGRSRPSEDELLGDHLYANFLASVEQAKLLVHSMTGGESFTYPD